MREENDKWRLALEALTPQGSEFHNDLDRCVGYVRDKYQNGIDAVKENVRHRRIYQDLLSWLITQQERAEELRGKSFHSA